MATAPAGGGPYEFTEAQNRQISDLASNMRAVSYVLFFLGILPLVFLVQILWAVQRGGSGGLVGMDLFIRLLTHYLGPAPCCSCPAPLSAGPPPPSPRSSRPGGRTCST